MKPGMDGTTKLGVIMNLCNYIGVLLFSSATATTMRALVEEAYLAGANLRGADLREADLAGAILNDGVEP